MSISNSSLPTKCDVNIDIDINEPRQEKIETNLFSLPDDPIELTPLASDDNVKTP